MLNSNVQADLYMFEENLGALVDAYNSCKRYLNLAVCEGLGMTEANLLYQALGYVKIGVDSLNYNVEKINE